MAFQLKLMKVPKRPNSTLLPTSTQESNSVTVNCELKDATSIYNPTFLVSAGGNLILDKNYAYVSEFGRYYFIREIVSDHNLWSITCVVDVMATFKTTIGTGEHYILRAASSYDGFISDNMYGAKIKLSSTKSLFSPNPFYWGTNSSYILGVIANASSSANQVGSLVYYQMDKDGLLYFIDYLMHHINDWCNISTAQYDTGVQEALLNPIQYIVSCVAVPVGIPSGASQASVVEFGYYHMNFPSSGHGKIHMLQFGEYNNESGVATIVTHPQTTTRGVYMNAAPFTEYIVHFGPFGDIPLDPAIFIPDNASDYDNNGLKVAYDLRYDLSQGICRLALGPAVSASPLPGYKIDTNRIAFCGTAQIGVPIQLSQAIIDPLKAQLSWETGMNSVVAQGTGSGLTTGILSNLLNAQNTLQETYADSLRNKYPTVQSKSNPGSFIYLTDSDYGCYLLTRQYTVVDEDLTEIGRPLCQVKKINTLSGYILCKNAECPIDGTREEQEKINAYLNSGFFYE